MKYLVGVFLVAHGLVHGMFLVPRPPDAGASWPFDPADSWLLSRIAVQSDLARVLGIALAAVTILAFVATAMTWIGVLPIDWLRPAAAGASVVSLLLLGVFFHSNLVIGVAIDTVLLWGFVVSGWSPE